MCCIGTEKINTLYFYVDMPSLAKGTFFKKFSYFKILLHPAVLILLAHCDMVINRNMLKNCLFWGSIHICAFKHAVLVSAVYRKHAYSYCFSI